MRLSYDVVAEDYGANIAGELSYKPLDRGLLVALVEQSERGWPIADIGCGPGHVASFLASHGATAVGIDLSPEMIALARRSEAGVEFREGDMVALPATDGEFASAVALYSIIHLQAFELNRVFSEVHRTLRSRGLFLVSFHVGSEVVHRSEWWGHEVDIDFRFYEKEPVIEALVGAGFNIEASLERSSYPEEVQTRRAYVLARQGALEARCGGDDLVPVGVEGFGDLVVHQVEGELVDADGGQLAKALDVRSPRARAGRSGRRCQSGTKSTDGLSGLAVVAVVVALAALHVVGERRGAPRRTRRSGPRGRRRGCRPSPRTSAAALAGGPGRRRHRRERRHIW